MNKNTKYNFDGLKNDIAELKAKDDQIRVLILREAESKKELKGKDQFIATLNLKNEYL
jgi:hypothetical protein